MEEMEMNNAAPTGTVIEREAPEPDEARSALVNRWLQDIEEARKHWAPDFKRMRRNMKFANGKQWRGQREDDPRYRVNLVQRVLKTMVASLYAKNPTVVYKRRPKLDFKLWDGSPETLMQAQQAAAMVQQAATDPNIAAGMTPELAASMQQAAAEAQLLLMDVKQGMDRRAMIDKIGKTLVCCTNYYLGESQPDFKLQMKQMLRRCRTTAVGYVKLSYQREMDLSETQRGKIADHAERLAVIGQLSADLADGEIDPHCAEAEELRLAIQAIESEPERIVREGPVFSFPNATSIIPSTSTEKLMGWLGADWIAEEIMLSPDRIKQVYGVDVGKSYTAYRTLVGSPEGGEVKRTADRVKGSLARCYQVWDKNTGTVFVVCEGHPDFLSEPQTPDVFIEQFFPYFALTFNDGEDEGRLFFDSDVENLTHPQMEFNRSKEALRQHRIANRPLYLSPKGTFEEEEVKALSEYAPHDVIEVQNWEKGRPVTDLLAPVGKVGVDPNLYETATIFEDMQRVSGNAEANLGGTAGGTATESSIAESSRMGGLGLDGDDLDDMLSSLFRATGTVLLAMLDEETVKRIAGPGAVWPQLTRGEIMEELFLEVEGGSSGKPNLDREAAVFERVAPFVLQTPGISPRFIAKKAIRVLDADVDLEEAFVEGMPSITAMNSRTQVNQSANDPNAQGDKGGEPQKASESRDQGQPSYSQKTP